ncbi:hypothetical protein [Methylobacterium organophilum]|uniref:Uncharacterized protein n=1 Tax=Methylobacterium organophilum TaxID=410 RepID=A0ABQ4T8P7_METOR|nr:hypothetical protein [Methylobacterium organophilum]UMY18164.1 hypothetical protein MMB17_02065 [Methylobacterium organophilum]GJE27978.1 hypothetical protein LKMONMHP_2840 [Methylobacterium organophilum]
MQNEDTAHLDADAAEGPRYVATGNDMDEILIWFRQQPGGVRTFVTLLQKLAEHGQSHSGHAALTALLTAIVRTYIWNYEEMPLSVEVAAEAQRRMVDLLAGSCRYDELTPAKQVDILNEFARIELG